jgi:hypothetical protein
MRKLLTTKQLSLPLTLRTHNSSNVKTVYFKKQRETQRAIDYLKKKTYKRASDSSQGRHSCPLCTGIWIQKTE